VTTTEALAQLAAMPGPAHFRLDGKRALVVAAESPVGSAIARAYAEAGAELALAVLRPDEAVVSAKRLQRDLEVLGARSTVYVMDVTLGRNVQVTTRQIAKEIGGVDVAVCASDLFLGKPIAKTSDSELQQVMAYNFNAHYFVARSASEEMRRNPEAGGRIVLVSHVLGERGLPNTSAYGAAHGATQQLVRSLSQELAPQGITVNGIALGWMDWMRDRLDESVDDAGRAVRFTLPRRAGTPEEVAPIALWLAGSGGGNVTGQVFHVDGGLTQHL
jgi:NAD(P)-dependent dehydrogenase (short-subunit alcohol dehydrogenase family)